MAMSPRHEPTAEALAREARVVELRRAGKSFTEIARTTGYASAGACHRVYTRALARVVAPSVDALRAEENDRLDHLQAAYWPAATKGDVDAAKIVLHCVKQRRALNGLDAPVRVEHTGPGGGAFHVIVDSAMIPAEPDPAVILVQNVN